MPQGQGLLLLIRPENLTATLDHRNDPSQATTRKLRQRTAVAAAAVVVVVVVAAAGLLVDTYLSTPTTRSSDLHRTTQTPRSTQAMRTYRRRPNARLQTPSHRRKQAQDRLRRPLEVRLRRRGESARRWLCRRARVRCALRRRRLPRRGRVAGTPALWPSLIEAVAAQSSIVYNRVFIGASVMYSV